MIRRLLAIAFACVAIGSGAQNFQEQFEQFKRQNASEYENFRKEANRRYADFLRKTWEEYSAVAPVPRPPEPAPLPPVIFDESVIDEQVPLDTLGREIVEVKPVIVRPVLPDKQPLPVVPIKERTVPGEQTVTFDFFGARPQVRLPEKNINLRLSALDNNAVADAWETLSDGSLDNLIRDCLETRIRYQMCDWAYLLMLDNLSRSLFGNSNEATLLLAWLFSQSGYQMRLGQDGNKLVMLFGSKHLIYDRRSYSVDGDSYYPFDADVNKMKITGAAYPGEQPLSLLIESEPLTGDILSEERTITSKKYPEISIVSQVKSPLIDFFDTYPTSAVGGNMMSRWAMYANTPLSKETKDLLYPRFREEFENLSKLDATQRILNWIQTGMEYGYDDEIWGGDRAFFAEETLYYPYCDCEDRSILFSRLVRDLLGLDVALIYYPGHLATAVKFDEEVKGVKMTIEGEEYTVCDPTYIGAPVGKQMPGMDVSSVQAIVLKRD